MDIFSNIILTLLSYAVLTNALILIVKMPTTNPITKFFAHSCGIAYLFCIVLTFFWCLIKIWS